MILRLRLQRDATRSVALSSRAGHGHRTDLPGSFKPCGPAARRAALYHRLGWGSEDRDEVEYPRPFAFRRPSGGKGGRHGPLDSRNREVSDLRAFLEFQGFREGGSGYRAELERCEAGART